MEHEEKKLEEKCVKLAANAGIVSTKNQHLRRGVPDRSFFPKGCPETVFVEFKLPHTHLDPLQRHWCWKLAERGKPVFVIDNQAMFARLVLARWGTGRTGTTRASRSR